MADAARLSIPSFKGEGDRAAIKTAAAKFLVDLDAYFTDRGLAGDADRIRAIGRCFAPTTPAEAWWHGYSEGAGKNVNVYEEVITAFKRRFVPDDTVLQLAQQRELLRQKPTESVAAYGDRCNIFSNSLTKNYNTALETLLTTVITEARVPDRPPDAPCAVKFWTASRACTVTPVDL
jgi:hypothetical protein